MFANNSHIWMRYFSKAPIGVLLPKDLGRQSTPMVETRIARKQVMYDRAFLALAKKCGQKI